MPEGPEVEAARKLVANSVLKRRIINVIAADDDKVFLGKSPAEIAKALEGRCITAACRKAKYLWFEMDGTGPFPLLHFGMTGAVVVHGVGASKYKRVSVDESEWPPKFCKLQLEFEDGAKLAFVDARRFGRVQLLDNPRQQEPVSKLGFDIIDELPDEEEFMKRFAAYQKAGSMLRVKALLLDQSFTAGVGNWVADEVLYQARIHPEQPVADMTEQQVKAVHNAIRDVMKIAVAADADSEQFPKIWLFHYRWTGKKASSVDGHKVEFVTVGSRTSAFVPALQKLIAGTGLSKMKPEPRKRASSGKKKNEGKSEEGKDMLREEPLGDVVEDAATADDPSASKPPPTKRKRGKVTEKPVEKPTADGDASPQTEADADTDSRHEDVVKDDGIGKLKGKGRARRGRQKSKA